MKSRSNLSQIGLDPLSRNAYKIPMARVTVEDCLKNVENRFALVHLAASRVRQLLRGSKPFVICKNKDIVTSLREIAKGAVLPKVVASSAGDDADMKVDISDL